MAHGLEFFMRDALMECSDGFKTDWADLQEGERHLILFNCGAKADTEGRSIEEILAWKPNQLEFTHDYIQWIFPLDEKSDYAHSPILEENGIMNFSKSLGCQKNIVRSFDMMLDFYGLRHDGTKVVRLDSFDERKKRWLERENHNFLRITRMLKSLILLGQEKRALAFWHFLDRLSITEFRKIGSSISHWRAAAGLSDEHKPVWR